LYRIGQPFKITKIRIPLASALTAYDAFYVYVKLDSFTSTFDVTQGSPVSYGNYGGNTHSVVLRPTNLTGDDNFALLLSCSSSQMTLSLPIEITYELLDVDTTHP